MRRMTIATGFLWCALAGCVNMQGEGQCQDTVTVNHEANDQRVGLRSAPPELRVCRGATITVRIVPQGTPASTAPKLDNPAWLNGSTQTGDITLTVPMEEELGAIRRYTITVEGVGMLDPQFRIIQ